MNARLTEIASIWKANQWLYGVGGFILGLLAYPGANRIVTDLLALLGDLVPEAVGIVATVLIIDRISEARRESELKERLVREAGSTVNSVAIKALHEIEERGWLTGEDGILKGANLYEANLADGDLYEANLANSDLSEINLAGADLCGANLAGADLYEANLTRAYLSKGNLAKAFLYKANLTEACLSEANLAGADLSEANLTGADLAEANLANIDMSKANLTGAKLYKANLEGAYLWNANLISANLGKTNLAGANLYEANLEGANLVGTKFDEKTTLPDAVQNEDTNTFDKYWTPDTDMTRYTDPTHPDFWQPDWVKKQEDNTNNP